MGELIALLFLSREIAHRAHLRANGPGSYAAHVALNDFYDDIVDIADSITEKYQGEYGILLEIPFLEDDSEGDVYENILSTLKKHKSWIDTNRYNVCPKEKTAIQNEIDSAVNIFNEAIYKLSFLK